MASLPAGGVSMRRERNTRSRGKRIWLHAFGMFALMFSGALSASTEEVTIPIRWEGAPAPRGVRVECIDASRRASPTFDAPTNQDGIHCPRCPASARYRFSADGFVPTEAEPSAVSSGVLMRAMAFLALVHEPADASPGLLPPASLTVVDESPHSHGLSFTVPATPEGTHSFRAPPGTWNILV